MGKQVCELAVLEIEVADENARATRWPAEATLHLKGTQLRAKEVSRTPSTRSTSSATSSSARSSATARSAATGASSARRRELARTTDAESRDARRP